MYITGKYWEYYIGGTDDSLTLVTHLLEKRREEIPLGEIFADFGLDKLDGAFRNPQEPLVFVCPDGWEREIYSAIDLVTDLAALLLECKVSGGIDMRELAGEETAAPATVRITATPEEHQLVSRTLADFAADPMAYDLSEMVPEEDMLDMAEVCEALRQELYGA
ncbi:MAG: hypothetical protein K2K53_13900 [Oscillospiraceae bacterium]|nr:hypothetical protein [Oscillospiraceae bacterium]